MSKPSWVKYRRPTAWTSSYYVVCDHRFDAIHSRIKIYVRGSSWPTDIRGVFVCDTTVECSITAHPPDELVIADKWLGDRCKIIISPHAIDGLSYS